MVIARVAWSGYSEHRLAWEALERSDTDTAVLHLDRAVQWYLPGAPWWQASVDQLQVLAAQAESERPDKALPIYETLRSGLLATRSFYTPEVERLRVVNDKIAALQVSLPDARWPDPSLPPQARYDQARALLDRSYAPQPGWSFLATLGFLGWVGSAFGFFSRAFEAEGTFRPKQGLRWGLGILVGYAAWVLGLLRA